MNKRQKKKAFKKKYGFNPPRKSTTYKIHMATKAVVKIWNVIKSILVRIGKAIEQIFARLSKKQKLILIEQVNKGHIVPTQAGEDINVYQAGKPVVVCNKCHKIVNIKPRYRTDGGIEYNYFTCKKCGEAYVISATDEALRRNIERYKYLEQKGQITEKEQQELTGLLQANLERSRELKEKYPFNCGKG